MVCVFKTFCIRIATRWCNGNTRDFGSLIGGSSPPRVAIVFYRQQRQVSNLSVLYLILHFLLNVMNDGKSHSGHSCCRKRDANAVCKTQGAPRGVWDNPFGMCD